MGQLRKEQREHMTPGCVGARVPLYSSLSGQLRNQVNCRHARIILLSSGKVSNREIAQRVDCTPQWVRKVIHRFNADGIEAVTWYPYFHASATPRQFTADLVEEIARVAVSPPRALIGMNQWSVSKLRQYLIEQKIIGSISLEWLRMLLRRSGIRWRRTKCWGVCRVLRCWVAIHGFRRRLG